MNLLLVCVALFSWFSFTTILLVAPLNNAKLGGKGVGNTLSAVVVVSLLVSHLALALMFFAFSLQAAIAYVGAN
jgi:hypothetical protein